MEGIFDSGGLGHLHEAGSIQSACRAAAGRRAETRVDNGPAASAGPTHPGMSDRFTRKGAFNGIVPGEEGWREPTRLLPSC